MNFRTFFCPKRLCDFFFVPIGCVIFFVPRGCMIFLVPRGWMTFFVPRSCMIFFSVPRSSLFFLSPAKQLPDYRASPDFLLDLLDFWNLEIGKNHFMEGFFFVIRILFTARKLRSYMHTISHILTRRYSILIKLRHQIRLSYQYLEQILIFDFVDGTYYSLYYVWLHLRSEMPPYW